MMQHSIVLLFSCSWVVFPPSVFPFRPSPVLFPPCSTCSSFPSSVLSVFILCSSSRLCQFVLYLSVSLGFRPCPPVCYTVFPRRVFSRVSPLVCSYFWFLVSHLICTLLVLHFVWALCCCFVFGPCDSLTKHFSFLLPLGFCISALFYWSSPFLIPNSCLPCASAFGSCLSCIHNSTNTTSKDIACELQNNFAKTDISKKAEMHSANIDSDIRVGHPYFWVLRTGLVIDLIQQTTSFQTGPGSEKCCYTEGLQDCSCSGSVSLHYANFPDKRSNESEGEPDAE